MAHCFDVITKHRQGTEPAAVPSGHLFEEAAKELSIRSPGASGRGWATRKMKALPSDADSPKRDTTQVNVMIFLPARARKTKQLALSQVVLVQLLLEGDNSTQTFMIVPASLKS